MKIKKLIAEEVKLILLENNILKAMEAVPPEEIEAAIAELTPIVQAELPKYAEENAQEGAVAEGAGESLQQGMAKLLTIVPGGRDLGAMYLAAIDKSTDPKIRTLFLVALVNLIAPVDLGTILSGGLIEFLGPLTALDDYLLVRKVLKLMKKQGLPSEKHHDQLSQLAGEEEGEIRDPGSGTTIPPGFTRVWGPDANEDDPEGLKERRMISVSRINRIIKEELEVVLTNEEVEEMFDLDMSALLDEMMSEDYQDKVDVMRARMAPAVQAAKKKSSNKAEFQKRMAAAQGKGNIDQAKKASNQAEFQKRMAAARGGVNEQDLDEKEDKWIQGADLKKGRCTPMGTPECPEGSPQYNLAKRFKSGDIHKANLKKGKNPHGPG